MSERIQGETRQLQGRRNNRLKLPTQSKGKARFRRKNEHEEGRSERPESPHPNAPCKAEQSLSCVRGPWRLRHASSAAARWECRSTEPGHPVCSKTFEKQGRIISRTRRRNITVTVCYRTKQRQATTNKKGGQVTQSIHPEACSSATLSFLFLRDGTR